MSLIQIKKPITLWNSNRIDIAAKILFIKFLEEGISSPYGEEVYLNHLKVWNNLIEIKPEKIGSVEYIDSFKRIISDIKDDKFDFQKSPILLNTNNEIINGSHRLAAAIYYNKPIYIQYTDNLSGQANCNYELFQSHDNRFGKLKKQYLDSMVMEYIERKKRGVFVVTIFPSARGFDEQVVGKIKEYGDIIYRKDFFLNKESGARFIRMLYQGEEWLKGDGGQAKANYAFPDSGYVRSFFIEINDKKDLKDLKQDLRDYFDIGKHSLHINDRREETIRISRHLLNENTIEFFNNVPEGSLMENAEKLFNKFCKEIDRKKIDKDQIMIVGSFVLALFQIRDIRDIDYISKKRIRTEKEFQSHNKYIEEYGFNAHEWLFNPQNYFYYMGVKVLSIETAKLFKRKRNETKDKEDLLALEQKFSRTSKNELEYFLSITKKMGDDFDRQINLLEIINKQQSDMSAELLSLRESINLLQLKSSPKWWIKRLIPWKK